MNDIMENIGNLTAIGRGEDFVEVLECAQTELTEVDEDVDYEKDDFDVYMPVEYYEENQSDMDIISKQTVDTQEAQNILCQRIMWLSK